MGVTVALTALLAASAASAGEAVTVAVDRSVAYQTIRGWLAPATDWHLPPVVRDAVFGDAIDDLGLTGLVCEVPGGRRWEWLNDNDDPKHIKWSAFDTRAADALARDVILPFKARVEDNGEPFTLFVRPSFAAGGATGEVPPWILHSPAEYAEYAASFLQYLKEKHGLTADYFGVTDRAGAYRSPFRPEVVGAMIKALGPRLRELALPTTCAFPGGADARTSWQYIQRFKDDAELWRHVGLLAYQDRRRRGTERSDIRKFAVARSLPIGMSGGAHLNVSGIAGDLASGGASYCEVFPLATISNRVPWSGVCYAVHCGRTSYSRWSQYWEVRQVLHYVRAGAVRVKATSDTKAVSALAFLRYGRVTVVVLNKGRPQRRQRTVTVTGLPPGKYGVSRTERGRNYREVGIQATDGAGALRVDAGRDAVLTIYPYAGANQPPTVTACGARPTVLSAPADKGRVSLAASATDPEGDPLKYAWRIINQPEGAKVVLARADTNRAYATGFSVPGEYLLAVAVSDPQHSVNRHVTIQVPAVNQPPENCPRSLYNLSPVMVVLPATSTVLCGVGRDLEGDALTYTWRVTRQPAGAAAKLETPTKNRCKASSMTVPGEYAFTFEVRDPTHTVARDLAVTVYPANKAPVIASVQATPGQVGASVGRTSLSGETSDPDGDVITHWWSVRKAPGGAKPVFVNPGVRITSVTGLTAPGKYDFRLTVIDRTKVVSRDVSVTVTP